MSGVERSEVRYGNTRIAYAIRRSPRRATVSIAIDPQLGVLVTAPQAATVAKLDQIVHRKARWIIDHLRRVELLLPPPAPREYVSGESFSYLGRQYRLRVAVADVAAGSVKLERGRLVAQVPRGLTEAQRAETVREALEGWYRAHAAARLEERVAVWAKKMEIPAPKVLIRAQRKRWASCDAAGTLRFNWRVIQVPMRLVDYVVAHELAHLAEPNHTREFWSRLGQAMPDYEERRGILSSAS